MKKYFKLFLSNFGHLGGHLEFGALPNDARRGISRIANKDDHIPNKSKTLFPSHVESLPRSIKFFPVFDPGGSFLIVDKHTPSHF